MFADSPQGIIQPATYSALRNADAKILDNEDFDVFGDGSVVVMATPGHTPGHQVVAVKLANRGTVVLGTDESRDFVTAAGGVIVDPDDRAAPVEVVVVADDAGFPFLETIEATISAAPTSPA